MKDDGPHPLNPTTIRARPLSRYKESPMRVCNATYGIRSFTFKKSVEQGLLSSAPFVPTKTQNRSFRSLETSSRYVSKPRDPAASSGACPLPASASPGPAKRSEHIERPPYLAMNCEKSHRVEKDCAPWPVAIYSAYGLGTTAMLGLSWLLYSNLLACCTERHRQKH